MRIRDRIDKLMRERPLLLPFIAALITTVLAVLAMVEIFP
jgi:hypothetical protein